nr:MAG TPA: hypothetical protein [Caudoviricetes sp.]
MGSVGQNCFERISHEIQKCKPCTTRQKKYGFNEGKTSQVGTTGQNDLPCFRSIVKYVRR